MYIKGELFRRMLDERMAGLTSIGFLDEDTDSLGSDVTLDERYHDQNDKGSVTYHYYSAREGAKLRIRDGLFFRFFRVAIWL